MESQDLIPRLPWTPTPRLCATSIPGADGTCSLPQSGAGDCEDTILTPSSQFLVPNGVRPGPVLGNWTGDIPCPQRGFSAIQELWAWVWGTL
jgi:hypothetical protein